MPDGLTIEAEIPAEIAGRLARHPLLVARRSGRTRATAETRSWLDTADRSLARQGLVLEMVRGTRRVVRCVPRAAPWSAGPDGEVMRILARGEAVDEAEGEPLLPLGEFVGRRIVMPLGPVQAMLLHGELRAGASRTPVARLSLAGASEPVLETIAALAAELPLLPPATTLAEQGRALVMGEPSRARRGPPDLRDAATPDAALAGAIAHLMAVAVALRPLAMAGEAPEGVHQLRVALRRLRSVVRVFRRVVDVPPLRGLDGAVRAVLDALGPARDWDVWLGGLGAELAAALPDEPRVTRLMGAARRARATAYGTLRAALEGADFRAMIWSGIALAECRAWRADAAEAEREALDAPLAAFGIDLLSRRWKRLRRDAAGIEFLDPAALHALRLDAKRMRYAAELFAPLWPGGAARRFLKRLARLQDALGLANDAAVARDLVRSLGAGGTGWAGGVAEGWAAARMRNARRKAIKAWRAMEDHAVFWPRAKTAAT